MGLDRLACTAGAAALAAGLALPAQAAAPKPPVQFVSAHPGNFTRRASRRIDRVIIHTVEGSYQGCIAWFRNPAARASAHYVVSFGGAITQMVADHDIAWHAGNWSYNERAVGIEHEGYAGRNLWTMDQYRASAALTRFLCEHYGIPKDRGHIIAHKDVPYPNTHWDPGPHFDWGLYLRLVNGGPPPTNPGPDYDGRWKAQHHDASLVEGESKVAWVEYENTGTRTWTPGRTRLGTTEPRDRPSAFHTRGNWVSPDRPTGVDHATAPGQTGRFSFVLTAPAVNQTRTFTEHWGLVEEGVTWFGPPGAQVHFRITVHPRPAPPPPPPPPAPRLTVGRIAPDPARLGDPLRIEFESDLDLAADPQVSVAGVAARKLQAQGRRYAYAYDVTAAAPERDGPNAVELAGTSIGGVHGRHTASVVIRFDADADGMPDAWEAAHGLDPRADDASGDPDGDGISNREEHAAGLDPRSGDLATLEVESDPSGALVFLDGTPLYAGRPVGVAPGSIPGLVNRRYTLRMEAPGRAAALGAVVLAAGRTRRVDLRLRRHAPETWAPGTRLAALAAGGARPSAADLDADGTVDLVAGRLDGRVDSLRNRSARDLDLVAPRDLGPAVGRDASPCLVDWDADGALDLLVGRADGEVLLFPGAAPPGFPLLVAGRPLRHPAGRATPFACDWDGDGDRDLLVGGADGVVLVFANDGTDRAPRLRGAVPLADERGPVQVGGRAAPLALDLDADGDLDLILGAGDGSVWVQRNAGRPGAPSLRSTDREALRTWKDGVSTPLAVGTDAAPLALDADGDGLRDLVVGNGAGELLRLRASHLEGDLDDSKKVDAADWIRLSRALGSRRTEARFDPAADLDDDGDVDRDDRDRLLTDLGRVY